MSRQTTVREKKNYSEGEKNFPGSLVAKTSSSIAGGLDPWLGN